MRTVAVLCIASIVVVGCSSNKTDAAKPTRVAVKHGTDKDSSKIDRKPKKISIEDLLAMRMPDGSGDLASYQDTRVAPFETSTYEIEGTIKSIVHRKDGDYYMVVQSDKGDQAVVEVPDPSQCKGSPLEGDISTARKELESRYHPTDDTKDVNDKVKIQGVGFMGWKGKPGSGANASKPRLMPGTSVSFGDPAKP